MVKVAQEKYPTAICNCDIHEVQQDYLTPQCIYWKATPPHGQACGRWPSRKGAESIHARVQYLARTYQAMHSKIEHKTSTESVTYVPKRTEDEKSTLEAKMFKDKILQIVSDMEQMRRQMGELKDTVRALQQSVSQMQVSMEEVTLKQEILEVKTISGVYIWKVNEVQRRAREARGGKTVSLYSPPFYTSAHGYRLCLRAYLYGDGAGKGTHVSVFLVIMRSEFDDVLLWPFKHRVVISLVNLDNPLKPDAGITHKFVPSQQSSSFEKPKETFNVASGFPQFAPLSILTDSRYVKNDTMYFRVKLEPPDATNKSSMDDL
eukprot:Em0014g929a